MTAKIARLYSAELEGIDAKIIEIEADVNVGLHSWSIVGLADKALNEAKERVNSAIKNVGVKPPNRENRKITISLAPADIKKTGSHYDLAIALGYLLVTKQIREFDSRHTMFLGELALDGRLRPVNGALNIAEKAARAGFTRLFLPSENTNEAAVIENIKVIPVESLENAIDILEGRVSVVPKIFKSIPSGKSYVPDFSEIKGQESAKRALTIAAAGGHNVIMIGPPGVGKSFLARALAGIMPHMPIDEAIEVTKIWSVTGIGPGGLINERPFRAPHHTSSPVALVGGGGESKPGEISLAHRGILFLDELPEFQTAALEALRQPMEVGMIHIARAKKSLIFPAKFTFVAAMNPCPCGYYGDPKRACSCTAYEVIKYQKKVSGPLLDRIDLQIKLGRVKIEELRKENSRLPVSKDIKGFVEKVRNIQAGRFGYKEGVNNLKQMTNSEMSSREAQAMASLEANAEKFLATLGKSHLSPRGYFRLLKVARTIADLEEKNAVSAEHLAEAFSYRLREEI